LTYFKNCPKCVQFDEIKFILNLTQGFDFSLNLIC